MHTAVRMASHNEGAMITRKASQDRGKGEEGLMDMEAGEKNRFDDNVP